MDDRAKDSMTPAAFALPTRASLMDAAQLMRLNDIGNVIIVDGDKIYGILTDRDIVVRGLAEGLDPATATVGDICSRELTTLLPTDSVGHAVRLMRDKALRRLPVVDETSKVVGIVSIGDVAVEWDRRSALADISAAPSNS